MLIPKNFIVCLKNYKLLNIKWTCVNCSRTKTSSEAKTKTYSHTILFPKTNFPARSNNTKREEIEKRARFSDLYNWQRENLKGPEYVLHDGPPYANGDLHMGHAVNKIIKDINNRSQVLQGNKVHYIPGWDCHGLPIEFKALQKSKMKQGADPVQIRKIAKSFALQTVHKQKEVFRSWGVMADWEKQCYLTIDKKYVQRQLRQFYKMYKSGLIYRALKPVYWSPSSSTALAEAELEYDPQFKSKEVYVTFRMENVPEVVKNAASGQPISAIVWTTTPWTLVANRAIAFNPQMQYSIVSLGNRPGEVFLVAAVQIEELEKILGVDIARVVEFDGSELKNSTYRSRLTNESLPFLAAEHVTKGKGTGLVHTAPAHGPDDFLVALKNNMTVECNVDEQGLYTNLGPQLDGLPVLAEGQDAVIQTLGDAIIHQGVYIHSYPLDWRTKKPVILRASQQWFIDTAALKERALAALDKVTVLPPFTSEQYRQGFRAQLAKRPYWCISRQRAWGVPIPVLYEGSRVIVDEGIIEKLCSLIDGHDSDVWWTCDVQLLLPEDLKQKLNLDSTQVTKGKDIMDIWLDSGLSWQTLEGKTAKLYSEGVDQLTGWFQASLLTSLALRDCAPYESIFVHGFVVDGNRRKMSKSIGNVVDPISIIHGDKKSPAYGVDTLRWWVASHSTQHAQIIISKKLLEDCHTEVTRIRNIIKFLLSVLNDIEKNDFNQKPNLNYFDQYIVNECHTFVKQINEHYNNFRYNSVAQLTLNFISKVSALYCHCIKDRLYCSHKNYKQRKSAQLTISTILVSLSKALGPILPHIIEEAWQHHPLYDNPFYFTQNIPVLSHEDIDMTVMDAILDLKRDICVEAKNENLKKFHVNIKLDTQLYDLLSTLNETDGVNDSVLCEILEVSSVNLEVSNGGKIEVSQSKYGQCLRCRKYNAIDNSDKCMRCEKVIDMMVD